MGDEREVKSIEAELEGEDSATLGSVPAPASSGADMVAISALRQLPSWDARPPVVARRLGMTRLLSTWRGYEGSNGALGEFVEQVSQSVEGYRRQATLPMRRQISDV